MAIPSIYSRSLYLSSSSLHHTQISSIPLATTQAIDEQLPSNPFSKHTKKDSHQIITLIGVSCIKKGGDLLSRLMDSTIGATGLNFSVRNGKRWNPGAITT